MDGALQRSRRGCALCRWLGLLVCLYAADAARAVDGVIPNLTYASTQVFKRISGQLSSLHLNQPSVFNGYLVLAGNAVHEVWDISNPYAPVRRATMTSPHAAGEAESHQVTYARTAGGISYLATISGRGVDIWNMTVTTNPVLVSSTQLPNINYGDVAGAIWGVAWQGNYLYAGATVHGLYVLDVSNPAAPQHIKTVSQASLGGVSAGPLFALGNLLVVTTPKDAAGIATVDITDPANPLLLDSVTGGGNSYIGGFYNGFATLITPLRVYDVTTDPRNIQLLGSSAVPASEYVSFADQFLFLGGLRGGTEGIYKYSITNPASPTLIGRYVGRNPAWDDQFSCPIGNLLAVADDQLVNNQYVGAVLVAHSQNPDTAPPQVLKVFPAPGAQNQTPGTRVALSLSEWPEFATVNASSFIVRPLGGQPLTGRWSCTYTLLNFAPAEPLLPNTTYEVVLPAGGLRDLAGNAVTSQFVSTFQTASGVVGFPGDLQVAPVPPTPLGNATLFSLALPAPPGGLYAWDFGDGITNPGASVSHTYAAPGRYAVTLRATQTNALYEAEQAQLAGGVSVQTEHAGYTGSGFADYPGVVGAGVYVRWTVNLLSADTAHLAFCYGNGSSSNRPLHLVVNGGAAATMTFPAGSAWTDYLTTVFSNVALSAGTNTIELRATAGSAGANLDSLTLRFPDAQTITRSFVHIVHRPLASPSPTHSRPLALDAAGAKLWVVNPDHDSVTAVNATNLTKLGEYPVGDQPETLAIAPDGTVWVANHGSSSLSVLDGNGAPVATVALPWAAQPYGLAFSPDGSNAFVALQALGRVLKITTATRAIAAALDLPSDSNGIRPAVRGVAVRGDGQRVFVSRFLSPTNRGEVFEIDATTMALVRTLTLANDPGPDTPMSARGVPNYLNALALNPDGTRLWCPSKKDNLSRGSLRDCQPLTHDMTVRAMSASIELAGGAELPSERVDYDNRDRAHAVCFSTLGDLAFVSMPGNNHVQVVNTYSGAPVSQLPAQKAPTGVLFDPLTRRLFVLNFLSRSLSAFDVNDLVNGVDNAAVPLGPPLALTAAEVLPPGVLLGKQLFYDATSARLNQEGYMSCASCHLDGGQDGRVWDFTGSGEGLRNTIDLRGRAGMGHGRLHWSANFDEVQDFEGQIRNLGGGTGLLSASNFFAGTRAHPLGLAKRGLSPDLDALADYVASLQQTPRSPYRQADGSLTADALAGRQIFHDRACHACHGGPDFTDSGLGGFHDVGTLKPSSGQRLGGPLTGIDTPTLRGAWATAPYLHDGSARTLLDVLTTANTGFAHADVSGLSAAQLSNLVSYLQQIDGDEPPAAPADHPSLPLYANFAATYTFPGGASGPLDDPDEDHQVNFAEFATGGSNPTNSDSAPLAASLLPAGTNEPGSFQFSYLRRSGGYWRDGRYRAGDVEYHPAASTNLDTWLEGVEEAVNPAGLIPPPANYEWATYRMLAPAPAGFGRLAIRQTPP